MDYSKFTDEELQKEFKVWNGVNRHIQKALSVEMNIRKTKPVEKKVTKEETAVEYTSEQLYAMDKTEQLELIKKLGSDLSPRLEKGRVELILKLQ